MAVRWLPHNLMLVDPFTNPLSKANVSSLLHVFQKGSFQIKNELEHLLERKKAGQYNSRLKSKWTADDDP
eukprot:4166422-Amphidinium_carterae.1